MERFILKTIAINSDTEWLQVQYLAEKRPTEEKIDNLSLRSVTLIHTPYCISLVSLVRIGGLRQAICCPRCGLRIIIPFSIDNPITIGDLSSYMEKKVFPHHKKQ